MLDDVAGARRGVNACEYVDLYNNIDNHRQLSHTAAMMAFEKEILCSFAADRQTNHI